MNNIVSQSSELLDIVSPEDIVIGQKERAEIYAQNLSCFRVINAFIYDNKKLWIPIRHPQKKLFPLCLDASVGGHVAAGESYDQAFFRETYEETGINTSEVSWEKIAYLTPHQHKTSSFMWIYIIYYKNTPVYNKNDFISSSWLTPKELNDKILSGEPAKNDLPIILKNLKILL